MLEPRKPPQALPSHATGTLVGVDHYGRPLVAVDGSSGYTITASAWPAGPPLPTAAVVLVVFLADGDAVIAAHLTRTP